MAKLRRRGGELRLLRLLGSEFRRRRLRLLRSDFLRGGRANERFIHEGIPPEEHLLIVGDAIAIAIHLPVAVFDFRIDRTPDIIPPVSIEIEDARRPSVLRAHVTGIEPQQEQCAGDSYIKEERTIV